jgi:heme oxygenase
MGRIKLIEALRDATREAHVSVERHFEGLLAPAPALGVYVRFLQTMWRFHAGLELAFERVKGWETLEPPFMRGVLPRTRSIEDDLAALREPRVGTPLSIATEPTLADGMGIAYVAEGSMLGARVLHRHLLPRLPIAEACRFITGYGDETLPRWKAYVAALSSFAGVDDPKVEARIVRAAIATFRALDEELGCPKAAQDNERSTSSM